MSSRANALLVLLLGCVTGCGPSHNQFVRVDAFPDGDQTNDWVGSLMSGIQDTNLVERTYDSPYGDTWSAIKRVSERLDKIGKRPFLSMDEKNGRIKHGNINEDYLIGLGGGAWADEFLIEATVVADNKTKVTVERKVIEKQVIRRDGLPKEWKTQWSNGKVENWFHTQIEDELRKRN